MDELTKMVIATSMRNMFEKGWFSISDVDQCLKLAGIVAVGREYELLRGLHCVHFNKMPRELAEKVPTLLSACFNGLRIDDLMKAMEPAAGALTDAERKRLN